MHNNDNFSSGHTYIFIIKIDTNNFIWMKLYRYYSQKEGIKSHTFLAIFNYTILILNKVYPNLLFLFVLDQNKNVYIKKTPLGKFLII